MTKTELSKMRVELDQAMRYRRSWSGKASYGGVPERHIKWLQWNLCNDPKALVRMYANWEWREQLVDEEDRIKRLLVALSRDVWHICSSVRLEEHAFTSCASAAADYAHLAREDAKIAGTSASFSDSDGRIAWLLDSVKAVLAAYEEYGIAIEEMFHPAGELWNRQILKHRQQIRKEVCEAISPRLCDIIRNELRPYSIEWQRAASANSRAADLCQSF